LPVVQNALEGKYSIQRQIARGGAARVFLAKDAAGTPVALKVLHPELAVSVTADRFLREISLLSNIEHPKISKLIDYGETDWLVYYVMPYVEGPTLREHLTNVGKASISDTQRIAADLLIALEYAHGQEIVHRDVKPENIVLSSDGPILVDFGIARAIASSGQDRLTRSGFAVGTSTYMSPEQVLGANDIDHRSDVYSLGCVLYECLAGRPPFLASREEIVLSMHRHAVPKNIAELRADTPEALAEAVSKALKKAPEDRWQSASEMLQVVQQGLA
jgi:serine/threonine-protein kinase